MNNINVPVTGVLTGLAMAQAINLAIASLQRNIGGVLVKTVAGNTDVTLTTDEYNNGNIQLTGALTGNINLIMPGSSMAWVIANGTTGAYTVTVKTASGTGIVVPQGQAMVLFGDGTNVYAGSQPYDAATAKTNQVQSYSKAQRGSITALTDGATITPDFSAGNNFSVTLGGNRTLANPTNLTAGQSGVIVITQDATGSRTLAFGSYFKFASGTAPALTSSANAVDLIAYYVDSATRISARFVGDVK